MAANATVAQVLPDRQSWLKARRGSLGGSDIASLFGHGYSSEFALWVRIKQEIEEESEPVEEFNPRFEMGHAAEPVLAKVAARDTGLHIVRPETPVIYRRQGWDRTHATPDAFALEQEPQRIRLGTLHDRAKGVVSFKTAHESMKEDWPDGSPSPYALIQIQHEMAMTQLDQGWVTVGFGLCSDTRTIPVEAHEKFQAAIRERIEQFWQSIQKDLPPAPSGSEADDRALRWLSPVSKPVTVLLEAGTSSMLEEYAKLQEAKTAAETAEEAMKQRLKLLLGDAELGIVPGYPKAISYKTTAKHDPPRPARDSFVRALRVVNAPREGR